MICQRCGNEIDIRRVNPDGTLTCPYCGLVYAPTQPPAAPQVPKQPDIQQGYGNQQNYGGQRGYSGQRGYGDIQPSRAESVSAQKKRIGGKMPVWGIVTGVVLLIVLIVVLIIVAGRGNSGTGNGNENDIVNELFNGNGNGNGNGSGSVAPAAGQFTSSRKFEKPKSVGDAVYFGRYEQDNNTSNGPEAIEWIVLEMDEANHRALLLSKYGLEEYWYIKSYSTTTWERCSLRSWLGGEFLTTAFSEKEISAILTTELDNNYADYVRDPNTQDKVFLLSADEANRYLDVTEENVSNTKARLYPTPYTLSKGAETDGGRNAKSLDEAVWWWTRTPSGYSAIIVDGGGSLNYRVSNDHDVLVRPALWLDLNADPS